MRKLRSLILLYLTWIMNKDLLYTQGTLLSVMWQPEWERGLGENGHKYSYGWITFLSTQNYYNTVNWPHSNIKWKSLREGSQALSNSRKPLHPETTGDRGRECQNYSQGLGGLPEAGIMVGFFVRGWNQRRDAVTVGALGQKQKERPILASLPPVSHQCLQMARPRQTSAWKTSWRGQLPCHIDLSPTWELSYKSY